MSHWTEDSPIDTLWGKKIEAATGRFSLVGWPIQRKGQAGITAEMRGFSLAGQDAFFTHTPAGTIGDLTAVQGTFTLTGIATAFVVNYDSFAPAQGSFVFSGFDAAFTHTRPTSEQLPVDIANIRIGYSTRLISSSYTGNVMSVREDGGGTLADISFDGNNVLDETALLNHVGANSGFIAEWYNQGNSGSGYSLGADSDAEQVRIASNGTMDTVGPNSRAAPHGNDGAAGYAGTQAMRVSHPAESQPSLHMLVAAFNAGGYLMSRRAFGNEQTLEVYQGDLDFNAGSDLSATGVDYRDGKLRLIEVHVDGANSKIVIDGTEEAAGDAGTQDINPITLFNTYTHTDGIDAQMPEYMLFGDVPAQEDLDTIRLDVADHYGINVYGWTEFPLRSDSKRYYVSSSGGSDSNDGLSESAPLATVAAGVGKLRNGYGDQVLFKRGDVWVDEPIPNIKKSSGDPNYPMLLGAYGTGDRPKIETGIQDHGCQISGDYSRNGLAFVSIEMHNTAKNQNYPRYGFRWLGDGKNVLFEDMYIHHYDTNFSNNPYETNGMDDITFRRCIIADAYSESGHRSQGCYISYCPVNIFEQCIIDHNGWQEGNPDATPNDQNHNLYVTAGSSVTLRGTILARAAATGVQARGGGTLENNLFTGNAVGMNFGLLFGGSMPANGVTGVVDGNVIIDEVDRPEVPGHWAIGIANISTAGATFKNNYIIRLPAGSGFLVNGKAGVNNGAQPVQNCLFENNHIIDCFDSAKFTGTHGVELIDLTFKNNTWKFAQRQIVFGDDLPGQTWTENNYYTENVYLRDSAGDHGFTYLQDNMEAGAVIGSSTYHSRDVPGYHASIGGTETLDAFMTECKKQRKGNWRSAYTAEEVNHYIVNG